MALWGHIFERATIDDVRSGSRKQGSRRALEILLGEENLRDAVDHFELAEWSCPRRTRCSVEVTLRSDHRLLGRYGCGNASDEFAKHLLLGERGALGGRAFGGFLGGRLGVCN